MDVTSAPAQSPADVFGSEIVERGKGGRRGRAVSYEPGSATPHGYWVLWSGETRPTWHPTDAVSKPQPALAAARAAS